MRIRYRGHSLDLRLTRDALTVRGREARRGADQTGIQGRGVRVRRRQHACLHAWECRPMSATTRQQDQVAPYQQPVDAVLAALGTDAQRGLSARGGAGAARTLWHERADGGEARARVEEVPRAVSRCARHPAAHRHSDFGRTVAVRARIGTALRSDGDLRRRAAQRGHGLHSGVTSGASGGGAAPDVGGARQRHSRRRAAEHPGDGGRARRHHPHRRRRHRSRRRAPDSVNRAANGGGGADGREPAGVEGHAADYGRGRTRRPPQHDLQRHGGDLRARAARWSWRQGCRPRWGASPGC